MDPKTVAYIKTLEDRMSSVALLCRVAIAENKAIIPEMLLRMLPMDEIDAMKKKQGRK